MKRINKLAILVACLGIVLLTAGGSYSFFNYFGKGSTGGSITTNGVTFHYQEGNRSIALNNALPLSNSDGKNLANYFDFDITSETAIGTEIAYTVTARLSSDSTLDPNVVKIYLTDQNENAILLPQIYGYLDQYSGVDESKHMEKVIYTDTVPEDTNYTKNLRARIWIDGKVNMAGVDEYKYYCDGIVVNAENYILCQGTRTKETVLEYKYNDKTFTLTFNVYSNGNIRVENELAPGLYDDNDNLIASWDTLVNTYGMNLNFFEDENAFYYQDYTDENNVDHYVRMYSDYSFDDNEYILEEISTGEPLIIFLQNPELLEGTKLVIPGSVGKIPEQAFNTIENLKEVIIQEGVTEIGNNAFSYDGISTGITSITLPNTLTKIGKWSFSGLYELVLDIPSSVTEIGESALFGVQYRYFGTATDPNNWEGICINDFVYDGDFIYTDNTKTEIYRYIGSKTNVVVPNGVTKIYEAAFYNADIETIEFPNGLIEIGEWAFYDVNFKEVIVPNTVTTVAPTAFHGTLFLYYNGSATGTSLWGASYINPYKHNDFIYTDNTKQEIIKYIGNDINVVIPDGVKRIDDFAFSTSPNLKRVLINDSMYRVGQYAFDALANLEYVDFEYKNNWTTYGKDMEFPTDVSDPVANAINFKNSSYRSDCYNKDR